MDGKYENSVLKVLKIYDRDIPDDIRKKQL